MFTQARMILAGLVVSAILAGGAYVWWTRKALANAQARVTAAEQSTDLATATTAEVEKVAKTEIIIRTQAERSVDVVQSAPGADTPLDPEFRDRLCAAVASLRDGAQACNDQPAAAAP